MLSRMDVVPREDFERLEAMVAKLRLKQEELEKRLNEKGAAPAPKKTAATTKKAPAKKTPARTAKKPAAKKKK
jgi:BMFP domain-containing protein YqiC